MKTDNSKIWLVGAGPMAVEYAKVLTAMKTGFTVIGRSQKSAGEFAAKTGIEAVTGGVERFASGGRETIPATAIVCVSAEGLASAAKTLISSGVKRILVEKPAALSRVEVRDLLDTASRHTAEVFVAYNRRFYSSVMAAENIVREDGGATSFHFEFTELSHIVEKVAKADEVKKKWFLANSTHVVDLAFYLGGKPSEISCYTSQELTWHPSAAVFAGGGVSETGALFSYHADWTSPGRWGVEIMTKNRRIILKPLEELHVQKKGSFTAEKIEIADHLDKTYKPGLFKQCEEFMSGPVIRLKNLGEQAADMDIYFKMSNYRE